MKVLITTHSDYVLKEINNLIMLSHYSSNGDVVLKKLGYHPNDALSSESVRAYIAENRGLIEAKVDRFGIDMPIFDETIDRINITANTLAAAIEAGSDDT